MASKKSKSTKTVESSSGRKEVDNFMESLDHPLKAEIEAVRAIILGADKSITESIKWNTPSFYFKEYFATFHLRSRESIQVVFHKGAKVKDGSTEGMKISDPSGLLKWRDKERCVATLSDMNDIRARKSALSIIVKQWIRQM
jgi:hypothetical protein